MKVNIGSCKGKDHTELTALERKEVLGWDASTAHPDHKEHVAALQEAVNKTDYSKQQKLSDVAKQETPGGSRPEQKVEGPTNPEQLKTPGGEKPPIKPLFSKDQGSIAGAEKKGADKTSQ